VFFAPKSLERVCIKDDAATSMIIMIKEHMFSGKRRPVSDSYATRSRLLIHALADHLENSPISTARFRSFWLAIELSLTSGSIHGSGMAMVR
jgi:hypothetical protein